MKKAQIDHVLRAARRITGLDEFIIVGSQALHAKHPDLPDELGVSIEVDLYAKAPRGKASPLTEKLNEIGIDSPFHESFGYYADPVDEKTAVLPRGWRERLVHWPPGMTDGAKAQCIEPHDLAIAKYVARREKDIAFNRELVARGLLNRERLLDLLEATPIDEARRAAVRFAIEVDFRSAPK